MFRTTAILSTFTTKKQSGKAYVWKNAVLGHFSHIRPYPVAESSKKTQKAHLKNYKFDLRIRGLSVFIDSIKKVFPYFDVYAF